MDAIETIERDGFVGEIFCDEAPWNPREDYDEPGTLLVQLDSGYLPPSKADARDWRYGALNEAWERWRDHEPVERYARVFLNAEAVAWWEDYNSGRVIGIIERGSDFTEPAVAIKSIVERYGAWCTGEAFGYSVTAPDGEVIDSCWGYLGDDELPYIRECIERSIEAVRAEIHEQRVATFKRLVDAR